MQRHGFSKTLIKDGQEVCNSTWMEVWKIKMLTHEARKSTPTGLGNCRKLRECKSAANTVCKTKSFKFHTTTFKAEHYEQRDIEHYDLQRDIEKVLPTVEASDIRLQLCKKPTLIHHKNLLAKIGKKIPFHFPLNNNKEKKRTCWRKAECWDPITHESIGTCNNMSDWCK